MDSTGFNEAIEILRIHRSGIPGDIPTERMCGQNNFCKSERSDLSGTQILDNLMERVGVRFNGNEIACRMRGLPISNPVHVENSISRFRHRVDEGICARLIAKIPVVLPIGRPMIGHDDGVSWL